MIDLPHPFFMEKTPLELGIGTWNNVSTITQNTPLIDIMEIFLSKKVSALPVLDENEKVHFVFFWGFDSIRSSSVFMNYIFILNHQAAVYMVMLEVFVSKSHHKSSKNS